MALLATVARVYGTLGAAALWLLFKAARWTTRVRVRGEPPRGPAIYCYWHGEAFLGFLYLFDQPGPMAAMAHPSWPVLPYRVLGEWLGWRPIVGSAGHGGRAAAEQLIAALRAGRSTFMAPDGPVGPARTLKRGVLHIARAADVPVVPLRFHCTRAFRLPRWDGWQMPLPGSTLTVEIGAAITADDIDVAAAQLTAALTRNLS